MGMDFRVSAIKADIVFEFYKHLDAMFFCYMGGGGVPNGDI